MSFSVAQRIHFCYGHRLLGYPGKCGQVHGHNAVAEIAVEGDKLDAQGMLIDFHAIKDAAQSWIDEHLDHTLLLHPEDPLIPGLDEAGEHYLAMEANPSAENIARLIFHRLKEKGLPVVEVRLWETPSSSAVYRNTAA